MPISSVLVAAESITKRSAASERAARSVNTHWAIVLRHMLPWQMNKIFIMQFFASLCRVLPYFMRVSAIFDFIEIRHKLASPCISWTSMLIKC